MKQSIFSTLLITAAFAGSAPAAAQTVPLMPMSGTLTDIDGQVIDGARDVALSIYEADSGGMPLYGEVHVDVPITDGQFVVYLGDGETQTPLGLDLFTEREHLWVEVAIDGTEVIDTRFPLGSVPYAAVCAEATHAAEAEHAVRASRAATCAEAEHAQAADTADQATSCQSAVTAETAETATTCDSANVATMAEQAKTAQTAATAADAEKLGGLEPSAYTYAAGPGLALSSGSFSIPPAGVTGSMLAPNLTYGSHLTVQGLSVKSPLDIGLQRKLCRTTTECPCPEGTKLVSGGAAAFADGITTHLLNSFPESGVWKATCDTANGSCPRVYAICAAVAGGL